MVHTHNEPTTPHDVAREKWIFWRYLSVISGTVAIVWMMCDCSGKWLDEAYREPVTVDSVGVAK